MHINQRGGSKLITAGVILIVGVIAAIGILVINRNSDTEQDGAKNSQETSQVADLPEATPVQIDTSSWQTFTNAPYGFTFKRPVGDKWNIKETQPNSTSNSYATSVTYDLGGNPDIAFAFTLTISDKGTSKITEQSIKTQDEANDVYTLQPPQQTKIATLDAKKYTYRPSNSTLKDTIYYFFSDSKYNYVIEVNGVGTQPRDGTDLTLIGQAIAQTIVFN